MDLQTSAESKVVSRMKGCACRWLPVCALSAIRTQSVRSVQHNKTRAIVIVSQSEACKDACPLITRRDAQRAPRNINFFAGSLSARDSSALLGCPASVARGSQTSSLLRLPSTTAPPSVLLGLSRRQKTYESEVAELISTLLQKARRDCAGRCSRQVGWVRHELRNHDSVPAFKGKNRLRESGWRRNPSALKSKGGTRCGFGSVVIADCKRVGGCGIMTTAAD